MCVCVHGVLIVGSLIISGEERVFSFVFSFFVFYSAFEVMMHGFLHFQ